MGVRIQQAPSNLAELLYFYMGTTFLTCLVSRGRLVLNRKLNLGPPVLVSSILPLGFYKQNHQTIVFGVVKCFRRF